uniref:Uncharacterized protein n=1 Tax=Anguilla anguilla TaxID=7936 RepID=A0A0E9RP72_ANGAN
MFYELYLRFYKVTIYWIDKRGTRAGCPSLFSLYVVSLFSLYVVYGMSKT